MKIIKFFIPFLIIILMFIFFQKVEANMETKQDFEYVKASHLLVDTQEEALELKQRIEKGEDFAFIASQYSKCPSGANGGDLGYFSKGQMVKEFEDASFNMEINEVSEPIKTQFGYHLIKVYDKK